MSEPTDGRPAMTDQERFYSALAAFLVLKVEQILTTDGLALENETRGMKK